MRWLVDGYNVIRRAPELKSREQVSLEAGRQALCALLVDVARVSEDTFTVVFDGAERVAPSCPMTARSERLLRSRARLSSRPISSWRGSIRREPCRPRPRRRIRTARRKCRAGRERATRGVSARRTALPGVRSTGSATGAAGDRGEAGRPGSGTTGLKK